MRRFTVETDGRTFDIVDEYGRRTSPSTEPGGLTMGEMLELLLSLSDVTVRRCPFTMDTDEGWAERDARRAELKAARRAESLERALKTLRSSGRPRVVT